MLRPLAFSEKITRRAVEACKGRVGQFGAAVEMLPPAGKERRVRAFAAICEGGF